ncbi:MAG TPA: homocysteine S-methyltransferase family protein, partial [Chloroflexota bacterium]|nr:homocysteine S-methyltransferase family protein [Chloroflexota bacterium]
GRERQARAVGALVPEALNTADPERVLAAHRAYLAAGAEAIETNSFGGTRVKLALANLEEHAIQLNHAAAALARRAADESGRNVWVLGSMGPTGALLEPYGDLTESAARDAFGDQAAALAAGGADALLIETMADLREALVAIEAAREATDLPVMVTFAFEPHGRTMMGLTPEDAVRGAADAGAAACGANCGQGPDTMLAVLRRMHAAAPGMPLAAQPNAGQPHLVGVDVRYDVSAAELASLAQAFVAAGVRLLGSCCGSTPEYTRALAGSLAGPALGVPLVH